MFNVRSVLLRGEVGDAGVLGLGTLSVVSEVIFSASTFAGVIDDIVASGFGFSSLDITSDTGADALLGGVTGRLEVLVGGWLSTLDGAFGFATTVVNFAASVTC